MNKIDVTERMPNGVAVFKLKLSPEDCGDGVTSFPFTVGHHDLVGYTLVEARTEASNVEAYVWLTADYNGEHPPSLPEGSPDLPAFWLESRAAAGVYVQQLVNRGVLTMLPENTVVNGRTCPAAKINLSESEVVHQCSGCRKWETAIQQPRFQRCGKCSTAYYCGKDCQITSWKKEHKVQCELYINKDHGKLDMLQQQRLDAYNQKFSAMGISVYTDK